MDARIDLLALRCLAHLEKEDAMLQTSWELVNGTREALLRRDHHLLQEILDRQQATATIAANLRAARQSLRADIAAHFSIPVADASLGYLCQHLPARHRANLLSQQQRLSRRADEVDLLNHGNAVLAGQVMDLLRGVLQRLTGENLQSACYERSGKRDKHFGGSRAPTF